MLASLWRQSSSSASAPARGALLGLAAAPLLALCALLVSAAAGRLRAPVALVSAPWHPRGGYLAQTLRSLRHDLRAKETHSRKLRQQLKAVFHPDAFAPREPWKHAHRGKTTQYGSDFLQSGQSSIPARAYQYPGDDAQHYRNEWFYNYEAAPYTGVFDDTAQHDQFSPSEPWNDRPADIVLDGTFADLQRACAQAGRGHTWDAQQHECLFHGVAPYPELPRGRGVTQEGPARQAIDGSAIAGEPCEGDDVDAFGACRPVPEGTVDQNGWRPGDPTRNGYRNPYDPLAATQPRGRQERDTTLDYQTADLEKACRRQMAKPRVGTLYSWDAWHGKCLYLGSPARAARQVSVALHLGLLFCDVSRALLRCV